MFWARCLNDFSFLSSLDIPVCQIIEQHLKMNKPHKIKIPPFIQFPRPPEQPYSTFTSVHSWHPDRLDYRVIFLSAAISALILHQFPPAFSSREPLLSWPTLDKHPWWWCGGKFHCCVTVKHEPASGSRRAEIEHLPEAPREHMWPFSISNWEETPWIIHWDLADLQYAKKAYTGAALSWF